MENQEFDRKTQVRIGKEIIMERKKFFAIIETCLSCGVYWRSKWETEEDKPEIRFIEILCHDTEKHREIYWDLWRDALMGKEKVFTRQIEPDQARGILEDGMLEVLILQYENDEDILADLESAASYIETRLKASE